MPVHYCHYCERGFFNSYNYKRHISSKSCLRNAEGGAMGRIRCEKCPSFFVRMDTYKRHMKNFHSPGTEALVFHCGICSQCFPTRELVARHRRLSHATHTDFRLREEAHGRQARSLRAFFPPNVKTLDEGYIWSFNQVSKLIETLRVEMPQFKINFVMNVEMYKLSADGQFTQMETFPFRSNTITVAIMKPMEEEVAKAIGDFERNVDEFLYQGSGWVALRPVFLDADVAECEPLSGGGCTAHPPTKQKSKGIVPDMSTVTGDADDGMCFYYAIAQHFCDAGTTDERLAAFVRNNIIMPAQQPAPVSITMIDKIEQLNEEHLKMAINVVYRDEKNDILPVRASKMVDADNVVVLLLFHTVIGGKNVRHYTYVNSPERLLAKRYTTDSGEKRSYSVFLCYNCMNTQSTRQSHLNHVSFCHQNNCQKVTLPQPGATRAFVSEQKASAKIFKSAYMLFFDFEALQRPAKKICSCSDDVTRSSRLGNNDDVWWKTLSDEEKASELLEEGLMAEEERREYESECFDAAVEGRKAKFRRCPKVKACLHKVKVLAEQPAFCYNYILVDRNGVVLEDKSYIGTDAAENFILSVLNLADTYLPALSPGKTMNAMTESEKALAMEEDRCCICLDFVADGDKVLDHDHLTGDFLGVAHNLCNLQRKEQFTITAFAHNFSGYDSHFLVREFSKFPVRIHSVKAIPLNTQKFKAFTINHRIKFLDSAAFLQGSLEKLVKDLKASRTNVHRGPDQSDGAGREEEEEEEEEDGGTSSDGSLSAVSDGGDQDAVQGVEGRPRSEQLKDGEGYFTILDQMVETEEEKNLMLQKGVYPYAFATSVDTLERTTELPSKSAFFSDLYQTELSDEDYERAKKVWEVFSCETMMDYTVLYVKCDVYLLAEVVMDLRNRIWRLFNLDLCQYLSLPHISFDIMLKKTEVELELIHDQEMSDLLQKNIRGGLSFVNLRHSEKEPPKQVEGGGTEGGKVLIYVDANNLYGNAMCFPLPLRNFTWMTREELAAINVLTDVTDKNGIGFILEVDLEYPEELHLVHNSFPLAPETIEMTEADLSEYSKACLEKISGKVKHKAKKLTSTFRTRYKYLVHGLNLKFYVQMGLKILRIRRGIKFYQENFVMPFVKECTDNRAKAKTTTEKNLWKNICNSVYGKFIEGYAKRMDCKFNKDRSTALKNTSSPLYKGTLICGEDLSISFHQKKAVYLKQSWAVGFSVLELSKLRMQGLYYTGLLPRLGELTVIMSDTDSFLIETRGADSNEVMGKLKDIMDFSNLSPDNPLFSIEREKVPGYLKNEVPLGEIIEAVALRSKTYAFRTLAMKKVGDVYVEEYDQQSKAKGTVEVYKRRIPFNEFKNCLTVMKAFRMTQRSIRSTDHVNQMVESNKVAFSSFDDKRYLLCEKHSVPYGSVYIGFSLDNHGGCYFCANPHIMV